MNNKKVRAEAALKEIRECSKPPVFPKLNYRIQGGKSGGK